MQAMIRALTLLGFLALASASYPCTFYSKSKDYTFDLEPLKLKDGYYVGTDYDVGYKFVMQFCQVNEYSEECKAANGAICVYNSTDNTFVGAIGTVNEPLPVWGDLNEPEDPNDTGLTLSFKNGKFKEFPATVKVDLVCDPKTHPSASDPVMTFADYDETPSFTLVMPVDTACAPSKSKSKGMSGGSVFLIIFFVTVPIYLVAGFFIKSKMYGTSGIESLPNIDFWRTLPGLVKDGCKYFVALVTCRTGAGAYSQEYTEV